MRAAVFMGLLWVGDVIHCMVECGVENSIFGMSNLGLVWFFSILFAIFLIMDIAELAQKK